MRKDLLYNVSYKDIQEAAFWVLHKMQDRPPQVFLSALAWLFLAACKHYDVDPRTVLEVGDRTHRRALDVAPQYPRAIAQFMREELPRA